MHINKSKRGINIMNNNIIITTLSILIGAILSYLISRYFFKKTKKSKSLKPYIDYTGQIFSIHDSDLANELSIKYRNVEVKHLYQFSLIFANDGDLPIKDIIEPLKVEFNKKIKVLDHEIFDISPEGIKIIDYIEESEGKTEILFSFKLLNSGDYFGVRFLVKTDEELNLGSIYMFNGNRIAINEKSNNSLQELLKITITAPEIPPILNLERIPIQINSTSFLDWDTIKIFFITTFVTITFGLSLNQLTDDLYLFELENFFTKFKFSSFLVLLSWSIVFILGIISILLFIVSLPSIRNLKRKKYIFRYNKNLK